VTTPWNSPVITAAPWDAIPEFSAPKETDNIKESSHEKIHIVASVSLEHGDGDCMDIVEFAMKMKANSIIEV